MRTTTDVINDAIKENSKQTALLYLFAFLFILAGFIIIGHGIYVDSLNEKVIGSIASIFCYPALHFARHVRIENITLRTLEIPLNNSDTSSEAAKMLEVLMKNVYSKKAF